MGIWIKLRLLEFATVQRCMGRVKRLAGQRMQLLNGPMATQA